VFVSNDDIGSFCKAEEVKGVVLSLALRTQGVMSDESVDPENWTFVFR
jgi:hypothetical protein